MIDLLYVASNRLEYTVMTFEALLENTDWASVQRLYIADDASVDATAEYLREAARDAPVPVRLNAGPFGGPVAAMNWYLDYADVTPPSSEMFGKIDNDMVVCPGWLPEMLRQMELHPRVDILGMEPGPWGEDTSPPAMPGSDVHRDINPCEHIGGKGLLRLRAFKNRRPTPGGLNGYFGFTEFQTKNPDLHKAWIMPDIPVFGLDQVREEDGPWRGLALEDAEAGWQRLWPVYANDLHYRWWMPT